MQRSPPFLIVSVHEPWNHSNHQIVWWGLLRLAPITSCLLDHRVIINQARMDQQNTLCYNVSYTYKFLRDVIFAVFADNLSSTKFKSSKFYKTVVIHLKYKV